MNNEKGCDIKRFKRLIIILGVTFTVSGVLKALFGDAAGATIVVATGLFLILISHFDVEFIKLPFMEAKLRDTLDRAEEIIERIKVLSVPAIYSAYKSLSEQLRDGTAKEREKIWNESLLVDKALVINKIDAQESNRLKNEFNLSVENALRADVSLRLVFECRSIEKELVQEWRAKRELEGDAPDVMALESKFNLLNAMSLGVQTEISQLELDQNIGAEIIKYINEKCDWLDEHQKTRVISSSQKHIHNLQHYINTKTFISQQQFFDGVTTH